MVRPGSANASSSNLRLVLRWCLGGFNRAFAKRTPAGRCRLTKYRRLRARLGAPKAIVAMAHHLARLVYLMPRYGENYVEKDIGHYEQKFRLQRIKWLQKEAMSLHLQLVAAQ
jgi:hypothetical protein